jgi:hypothetical protein
VMTRAIARALREGCSRCDVNARHMDLMRSSEYVLIRREVTRLYHSMLEMEQNGLVSKVMHS